MAEVTISINGRTYDIACDSGQEGRVVDLAAYIDQKLQQIARGGGAYNDMHLMVLTSIIIADELLEERQSAGEKSPRASRASSHENREDDTMFVRALEHLTKRIDGIASRVQSV